MFHLFMIISNFFQNNNENFSIYKDCLNDENKLILYAEPKIKRMLDRISECK